MQSRGAPRGAEDNLEPTQFRRSPDAKGPGRCFSPYHGRAPLSLVLKRARLNAPVKIISGDTIVFRAGGGRLPPMAPCGRGVEPSAPRTARDGRLRDRGQRPGQESSISKSASAAPALFHILNACCTFSTVRRCCTPLPPAASTPPITRFDPLPRAYSAQTGAPASSAASHQISSPFTCTSCPHACDAASCMP